MATRTLEIAGISCVAVDLSSDFVSVGVSSIDRTNPGLSHPRQCTAPLNRIHLGIRIRTPGSEDNVAACSCGYDIDINYAPLRPSSISVGIAAGLPVERRKNAHKNHFRKSFHMTLSYTCNDSANIPRYEAVLTAYLGARSEVPTLLTELLAAEPEMPMAICLQGYLLKLAAHPKTALPLTDFIERARSARPHANPREAMHIDALMAWAAGQDDQVISLLEDVLSSFPDDITALRVAHYLHFYTGIGQNMLDSTSRVLPAWSESDAHYPYLLGMHAFALEESGEYELAEYYGRRAAELNPADLWAVHAVAHVLYSRGEHKAGIDWLMAHETHWQGANNFRFHLHWHAALHHLQLNENQAALNIYDQTLAKSVGDDFYLDLCNNSALLYRLEYRNVDVGDRWQALVEIAETHATDQELVFAGLHYLLCLARTGSSRLEQAVNNFSDWGDKGTYQAEISAKIAVPLAQQLVQGTPANGWQAQLYRVGGSHAQRELFAELVS